MKHRYVQNYKFKTCMKKIPSEFRTLLGYHTSHVHKYDTKFIRHTIVQYAVYTRIQKMELGIENSFR